MSWSVELRDFAPLGPDSETSHHWIYVLHNYVDINFMTQMNGFAYEDGVDGDDPKTKSRFAIVISKDSNSRVL